MNDNNIVGIKLINGAEIIGKLKSVDDESWSLDDAVFWDIVPAENGKYDVQFLPLSPGIRFPKDQYHPGMPVVLVKSIVMFSYPVREEIENRYKQLISPILLLNK